MSFKLLLLAVFFLLGGCIAPPAGREVGIGAGAGAGVRSVQPAQPAQPQNLAPAPSPQMNNQNQEGAGEGEQLNIPGTEQPQPQPEAQPQPQPQQSEQSSIAAGIETHAVADPQYCRRILRRMLRDGRRIRFLYARNTGRGDLPVLCYFRVDEPDQPDSGYYSDKDTRYNNPDEFRYP